MKNTRLFLMGLLLVFLSCSLMAQDIQVKGIVTDGSNKEPLPFVTIQLKGTTQGVNSDDNGFYTMKVPSNATLIFSFVGYKTAEVAVKGKSTVNVTLEPDVEELEDLIVIAYGTAKKGSFTGSSTTIKSDMLESKTITSATSALLGTASGVAVGLTNGQPGSSPSINVRGLGSLSASNSPLIVLDGMPYDNSMSSINPGDIESITVLKDASSSALYGARAANGVILITTKKGKKDRLRVNVKFNQGFTAKQNNDYKTVGVNDYITLYWENLRNRYVTDGRSYEEAGAEAAINLFDNLAYNPFNLPNDQVLNSNGEVNPNAKLKWADDTDWLNAIQRVGMRTDASISISGGSKKSDYFVSVGYTNEQGYIIGSNFKRYTARSNINSQITKFLKVGTNLSANMSSVGGKQNETQGDISNPFRFARYIAPIYPIHLHNPETGEYLYNENGEKIYDFGTGYSINGISVPLRDYLPNSNPAIELKDRYDQNKRNTINCKVYAEVSFLKDFKFTFNGGIGLNSYLASSAKIVYPEKGNTGHATKTNTFTTTWTFNELLTYRKI